MDIAVSKSGRIGLITLFCGLVLFLYAPLIVLVAFSFNRGNLPVFPFHCCTVHAYEQFGANAILRSSLRTSAQVAATSSAVTVAVGTLAAIVLVRRNFLGKVAISALLLSPLVIPYIALAIGLLIFVNSAPFLAPGIQAIIVGHMVLSLPYTVLVLVPRLDRIDVHLEEAARDLGAGSLRTFRSITLPLILPAIVSAFLIAFVISFDEVVVASFINGTTTTFPIYLVSQLRFAPLLPQVIATAVIVMAASALVMLIAEVGRRIAERRLSPDPTGSETT
jgi:spermidine/putrescine transport system permease protein